MFGELYEEEQPKTSLAKYLIEFNDLAVQRRPYRIPFLRLLGRPYTLLYVSRSVGRLRAREKEGGVFTRLSKKNEVFKTSIHIVSIVDLLSFLLLYTTYIENRLAH